MTQKTKLEIIGPYTPEHEGPFCTRDGKPVRVLCSVMKNEWSIVAIVLDGNGEETVSCFLAGGKFSATGLDRDRDIMNARAGERRYNGMTVAWHAGYDWAYSKGEFAGMDCKSAIEAHGYGFTSKEHDQFLDGVQCAQNDQIEGMRE